MFAWLSQSCRLLKFLVVLIVASSVLTISPVLPKARALVITSESALVSGNAFLRHNYSQVGARPNGSFGSENGVSAPSGWVVGDQSRGTRLGFISDRDEDGFDVTPGQVIDGDFFAAGTPYEAWGIQVGSNLAKWNHDGAAGLFANHTEIPGAFLPPTSTSQASVTWNSTGDVNSVGVSQTYSLPSSGAQTLRMGVTLKNNGATATDVIYVRAVDADNCKDLSVQTACTLATPSSQYFETFNKIDSQALDGDTVTSVVARQASSSLHLWTAEKQSVALFGVPIGAEYCQSTRDLSAMYQANRSADFVSRLTLRIGSWPNSANPDTRYDACTFTNKKGAEGLKDEILFLLVKKTIPAGQSVNFDVHYSMTSTSFTASVPETTVVSDVSTEDVIVEYGASTIVSSSVTMCVPGQSPCDAVKAFSINSAATQSSPGMVREVVDGVAGPWIPVTYSINSDGSTTANYDTGNLTKSTTFEFILGSYVDGVYVPVNVCFETNAVGCVLSNPTVMSVTVNVGNAPADVVAEPGNSLPELTTVAPVAAAPAEAVAVQPILATESGWYQLSVIDSATSLLPSPGIGTRIEWKTVELADGYEVWLINPGSADLRRRLICRVSSVSFCEVSTLLGPRHRLETITIGKDGRLSPSVVLRYRINRKVPALKTMFRTDSWKLSSSARRELREFATAVRVGGFRRIHLAGHTDRRGGLIDMRYLSEARNRAVRRYLQQQLKGLPVVVQMRAYAFTLPSAPNNSLKGMKSNRRVEIFIS